MSEEDNYTLNEALLKYTEIKVEMAKKFRDGITYEDFYKFERQLDEIDKILQCQASRLIRDIEEDRR